MFLSWSSTPNLQWLCGPSEGAGASVWATVLRLVWDQVKCKGNTDLKQTSEDDPRIFSWGWQSMAGVITLKRAAFPVSSLPANTAPLIFAWYNYKHMWQGLTPHIILYSGVFQSPYLTRLSKNCHIFLCKASTVLNGWRLCGWCIALVSHRNLLCWTPSLASCTSVFCWNANMHTGKSIPFTLRWVCFSWLQDMHKGGVRFLEEKLML